MANERVHLVIRKVFDIRENLRTSPLCSGRRRTREDLATVFRMCGFTVGAEIGVRRGRFSEFLCRKVPGLHLYCVDPWSAYSNKYTKERQDTIYAQAMKRLEHCNVTVVRRMSLDAAREFSEASLEFVFIDGDHRYDYVAPDIIEWSSKVKSGGIIAVHDYYRWSGAGVMQAVDGYLSAHEILPWYVTKELEPTAFWVKP